MTARRAAATAAAGAGMLLVALAFDASPLFVPALGLLIAGAAAPAWVWSSARGARVRRELRADRVIEDEPLTATLIVRRGRLGLPGAEVADPFTGARLELSGPLSPFTGDREARVRVVSRFARRGAYTLNAPVLHVSDPLDLARMTRSGHEAPQSMLVLPRTFPVAWLAGGGHRRLAHSEGDAATEAFAAVDLDGLRPYRAGTPASRIHWPAVARGAGLIERRLSADSDTRPLVVLDTRGMVCADDVDAAVRAAASLTLELARRGGCGLLLPGEQRPVTVERDLSAWPAVYARLATVPAGPQARPPVLTAGGGRPGAMIYVAARAPERLLREPGRGRVVLVVPTRSLRDGRPPQTRGGARAVLEVAGCRGFELGVGREREAVGRVAGSTV